MRTGRTGRLKPFHPDASNLSFESLFHRAVFAEGDTMKTLQESKMLSLIFIGRWTPKILFSLKQRLIDMGSCAAGSEAFRSGCLPELFAVSNRQD
jgi:hypothetical protein